VWIRVIQSIDSQRTAYVVPTSFPATDSAAVPGGSAPRGGAAALPVEQPATSSAVATVQTLAFTLAT
jgi:hypothetical protein